MTYRGVYRDGVVVLQGDVDLEDGARVDVNPAARKRRKGGSGGGAGAAKKSLGRASRGSKAKRADRQGFEELPGAGIWKDRWPKSMSSAEVARKLREDVSRRRK